MSVFFDYKKSTKTATGLIRKFGNGKFVTITRETEGTGKRHNRGIGIPIVYKALGVVLPASKGTIEAFDVKLANELIMQITHFVIMSADLIHVSGGTVERFIPQPTDQIEWNGLDLTVLGCTPLAPAGTPVFFPMGAKV